jgi:hypothetical protein
MRFFFFFFFSFLPCLICCCCCLHISSLPYCTIQQKPRLSLSLSSVCLFSFCLLCGSRRFCCFKMSERSFNVTTSARRRATTPRRPSVSQANSYRAAARLLYYPTCTAHRQLTEIKSCRPYKLMRSMSTEYQKTRRARPCIAYGTQLLAATLAMLHI